MDFVWSRQFGRVRVAVICEGTGWWPMERALDDVPEEQWRPLIETDDQNRMALDFNVVHLALPGASILLDTGFGEYDPNDPAKPLMSLRDLRLTAGLEHGLAALGVRPEGITHVVITHMHGDHVVGATKTVGGRKVPAFSNARYYVMAEEWRSAPAPHQRAEAIVGQKEALIAAGVVELVAGEREIVPGVTFVPAPGESPGHAIVRVATDDGIVYYLGDLFHQAAEFSHLDWMPLYRDRKTLMATRKELLPRFVAEKAWLIPAHHPFPAIGQVESAGEAYRWLPLSG